MLVLTRKLNETIEIAGGITVKIVQVSGGKVRLGIDAPPETNIKRGELNAPMEAESAAPLRGVLERHRGAATRDS